MTVPGVTSPLRFGCHCLAKSGYEDARLGSPGLGNFGDILFPFYQSSHFPLVSGRVGGAQFCSAVMFAGMIVV